MWETGEKYKKIVSMYNFEAIIVVCIKLAQFLIKINSQ